MISDYEEGLNLTTYAVLVAEQTHTGQNPRWSGLLRDGSGDYAAVWWGTHAEVGTGLVKIQGKLGSWKGDPQIVVTRIRKAGPGEVDDLDDVLPCSKTPRATLEAMLNRAGESIADEMLRDVWSLTMTAHGADLLVWPASSHYHQAYRGGLAEHVCGMLAMVPGAAVYGVDLDIVRLGILWHDLGKLGELDECGVRTLEGATLGHLVLGLIHLDRLDMRRLALDRSLVDHLKHIIASHHGPDLSHGSIVPPMTPEATLVHQFDDLDSRMAMLREGLDGVERGQVVYRRPLGQMVRLCEVARSVDPDEREDGR